MNVIARIKNKFSKDYCHICNKSFKNYRGYRQHVFKVHTNHISDEGLVLSHHENMKRLGEQYE